MVKIVLRLKRYRQKLVKYRYLFYNGSIKCTCFWYIPTHFEVTFYFCPSIIALQSAERYPACLEHRTRRVL